MWQRFTERARKVIFYAQEEAQNIGEGYVSTEHVLLGLIRESDSLGAQVMVAMEVNLDRVRREVEKQLPRGDARPSQDMTLTPRAKRVIDLAYEEARAMGHNYIGTEHLLLGLVREGDGLAGRVLAKLGLELELTRLTVLRLQATQGEGQASGKPGLPAKPVRIYGWDEYDDETQKMILRADELSKAEGSPQVTPYYLMKALLEFRESTAVQILKRSGVEAEKVDDELEAQQTWAKGAPPIHLSPYAHQILHRTTIEASGLDQASVGSDALLLGLVFGNIEGIGRILAKCGLGSNKLRELARQVEKDEESTD